MSAIAQISESVEKSSWTISTSPELVHISLQQQEILKIFSQPVENKMQGMCRFEKGFEKLLPLFRGLVVLGKPTTLNFIYDFHQAQIFFTFSLNEKKAVERFFGRIIDLLKNEVRFKKILEKVIENNRKYQAEQSLLQSSLHQAIWD